MEQFLTLLIHDTLLLLAVVNPIGNIPVYADLTEHFESTDRRRVMNLAVVTSLVMVIVFALVGNWSLVHLFGITLMEFRIAGGILLFIVAMRGVMQPGKIQTPSSSPDRMLAIFPLAFPIMVGPGTLTMTIIMAQRSGPVNMVLIAGITFALVFLIVHNAHLLMRILGPYAGKVIPRLLYIFLAAKAISMVLDGTEEYIVRIIDSVG